MLLVVVIVTLAQKLLPDSCVPATRSTGRPLHRGRIHSSHRNNLDQHMTLGQFPMKAAEQSSKFELQCGSVYHAPRKTQNTQLPPSYYVAFRIGQRFDSFESFETIFLVLDFSQNPQKQDGQRKDKMSRPFSRRPLVLRGPKGCGTNHFFGSKCGRRGAACRWCHGCAACAWHRLKDCACTGIRTSFRFSVVHSPHRRPRRFCLSPMSLHFSKGHNRSVAHVCQAAAGRAVSRPTFAAPTNGAATGRCRT
jgi:hypothetical protein